MPVVICMLRGVNVGANNRVKMDNLKKLCTSLKLRIPQTYVQSGNIVFTTDESDLDKLRKNLESAIHKKFGFQSDVVLRTTKDFREVIAGNPFAKRKDIQPSKLLVTFSPTTPANRRANKPAPSNVIPKNFSSRAAKPTSTSPTAQAAPS